MKQKRLNILLLLIFLSTLPSVKAQTPQQEVLNRGVVAVKTSNGVFVSWRYLGTDSPSAGFNLYRDG